MDITPLRNLRAQDWRRAVERDGFQPRKSSGSHQLLRSTRWTADDLRRLGLVS